MLASKKFPDRIKAKFVLLDLILRQARLLLDNHEPYGFHLHQDLPNNKQKRKRIDVTSYEEALEEFWKYVWEILANEKI